MTHLSGRTPGETSPSDLVGFPELGELEPRAAEVYATAAGFYVALVKNRYYDEADEFAEWFLETFDLDLES